MIKLYGLPVSNYYAMVKVFMLEKGFEFEEVHIEPSYSYPFLDISPMGKVPIIELNEGYLSETTSILGFLETCIPDMPMSLSDPFLRAKMAELLKIHELYLETQARRLYGYVFLGQPLNAQTADEVKPILERGLTAVDKLARFSPWLMGDSFTVADVFAYYTYAMVRPTAQKVWGWDVVNDVSGLREWLERVSARPSFRAVNAERAEAIKKLVDRR